MTSNPDHRNHGARAPEADASQAPPGDGAPAEERDAPLVTEREPDDATAAQAADADADEAATADPVGGEELEQLTARAAKADEYLALAQRKQAEFENFRKRSARETASAQERGATKLVRELLPAVDNLERALDHAPDDGDFVAGIRHVHSDVLAALSRAGIERFSPEGEPFDPTLHEAVAQQPVEGAQPGTVVEVFQSGYRLGETVVRPARVIVAG